MATAAAVVGVVSTIGGIAAASKKGRGPRAGAYHVDKTPFAERIAGAGRQAEVRKDIVSTLDAFRQGKDLEQLRKAADDDARKKNFAALRSGGRGSAGAKLRMWGKQQDRASAQGVQQAMLQRGQRQGQVLGALGSLRQQDVGIQKADKASLQNYERLRSGAAMAQDRAAMAADAADRKRSQDAWGAGAQGLAALAGADGGRVSGPGTERSDSIPAMLSDGEFVVNAKTVRGLGRAKGGKNKNEDRALGMKFLYEVQEKFGKNPPFAGKNQSLNEERKIHEKNLKEDQEDDDKEFDEGQKKLNKKVKKDKKFLNKYIEVKKYNGGGGADSDDTRGEQEAVDFLKMQNEKAAKAAAKKEKEAGLTIKHLQDRRRKRKWEQRPDRELGAGEYKDYEDFRRRQQKAKREAKLADSELGDGGVAERVGRESLKKRKEEERRKQLSKDLEKQDNIRRETARKNKLEKLEKKPKETDGKKTFAKALAGVGKKLSGGADQDTYSRDLLAQRNPEIFRREITSKSLDLKDGGGAKEEFIAALGPHVDSIIESYEFGRGFGEVLAAKNKLKAKKRK